MSLTEQADRLASISFPRLSDAVDLAVLRDIGGTAADELVVLGDAGCATGRLDVEIRDAVSGRRLACYALESARTGD